MVGGIVDDILEVVEAEAEAEEVLGNALVEHVKQISCDCVLVVEDMINPGLDLLQEDHREAWDESGQNRLRYRLQCHQMLKYAWV